MGAPGWAALLMAGVIWMVLPPAGERRLSRRVRRRLPGWLTLVPDALGTRPRALASGALAVAVALWTSPLGWAAVVPAGIVAAVAYLLLGRVTPADRARRTAALVTTLPQVCDLLAVAVAAGLPLRRAVEVVADAVGGAAGQVLEGIAARVRLGESESQAWAELEPEPAWELVAREVSR
ncbi:MAG: type II secretion system F family protein, partial [Propionibacteriaceae bacterium]|nr:type II secretion system F family protein [Propionibacteriaceae bacterium]